MIITNESIFYLSMLSQSMRQMNKMIWYVHDLEEFEDTKGVIRTRKPKDRQRNCQKKKGKRTNNDLQKTTQETNDPH
jgi:hypothetical protein